MFLLLLKNIAPVSLHNGSQRDWRHSRFGIIYTYFISLKKPNTRVFFSGKSYPFDLITIVIFRH